MWAYTRQGKFHGARTRLSLEQLEARQLMAADLLASTLSSMGGRTPNQPTSTPVVASPHVRRHRQQPPEYPMGQHRRGVAARCRR